MLSAATLSATEAPPVAADPNSAVQNAYFQGKEIQFTPARPRRAQKTAKFGPWQWGPRLTRLATNDKRPNLYIVSPGTQHVSEQNPAFDHSLVLSALPKSADAAEFDAFFAVVLDPELREDFRSEDQLLLAAQTTFQPPVPFTFEDIPGKTVLRDLLGIDSLDGIEGYRKADGSLPRLIIVEAGFAVRAGAIDPENPPPPRESGLARAWSRLRQRHSQPATAMKKSPAATPTAKP